MVRPRHWACEDDEVNNRLDKSIIVRESIKERFILGEIETRDNEGFVLKLKFLPAHTG